MVIVLGIFLIRRFGSLAADAGEGSLPMSVLMHLLALRTVMALPSLLPVVVYLGVVLGLSRLHRDREMIALRACGVTPLRTARRS